MALWMKLPLSVVYHGEHRLSFVAQAHQNILMQCETMSEWQIYTGLCIPYSGNFGEVFNLAIW